MSLVFVKIGRPVLVPSLDFDTGLSQDPVLSQGLSSHLTDVMVDLDKSIILKTSFLHERNVGTFWYFLRGLLLRNWKKSTFGKKVKFDFLDFLSNSQSQKSIFQDLLEFKCGHPICASWTLEGNNLEDNVYIRHLGKENGREVHLIKLFNLQPNFPF